MITENALHILFRRIQPETVIQNWLDSNENPTVTPLSIHPNKLTFNTALQNEYKHYSTLEAEYVYDYFDSKSQNSVNEDTYKSYGVFGVIAHAVKDYLILDPKRDCLGYFHGRTESHPTVIHQFQKFRDKFGQADIAFNLSHTILT